MLLDHLNMIIISSDKTSVSYITSQVSLKLGTKPNHTWASSTAGEMIAHGKFKDFIYLC
jgi:hypothetical protein